MGILFTAEVGKLLTRLLGNYLTATLGKVLDIYSLYLFSREPLVQMFSNNLSSFTLFLRRRIVYTICFEKDSICGYTPLLNFKPSKNSALLIFN